MITIGSSVDYLKTLPYVDMERVGMMGWSHGGYITLLSVFRDTHPFAAAAAIVPVTNLIFRLSLKGPSYQWDFATQKRIQGLPFEKPEIYIERSPLYHVDKLQVPVLVHVATNDTDVNYVEDQQIVDALKARGAHYAGADSVHAAQSGLLNVNAEIGKLEAASRASP